MRVIALAVIALTGCSSQPEPVTVFAAASLTDVAPSLQAAFEREFNTEAVFTFGGSSLLASQISMGAPADVFLSASQRSLAGVEPMKSVAFAVNEMVIAVQAGNPLAIAGPADLKNRTVAACDVEVPCGGAAAALLKKWALTPVTLESDVRAVAGKVALGEVDAGVVYRTDVLADARLQLVEPGGSYPTTYVAGVLTRRGEQFVEFMRSERARALLRAAGFQLP